MTTGDCAIGTCPDCSRKGCKHHGPQETPVIGATYAPPDYYPGREVRVTSATGGQKGQKNIRLGGADPIAMLELGRVYGVGETKYDRFNYLKGYAWSLSIDALKRHLLAFESGQEYDECTVHPGQHGDAHVFDPDVCDGSGLLHTAHVAWHGLALTSFLMRGIGEDDRWHGL